ncbi:MAG: tetratricopeptide repeat protein [Ferruginibacter sp.]
MKRLAYTLFFGFFSCLITIANAQDKTVQNSDLKRIIEIIDPDTSSLAINYNSIDTNLVFFCNYSINEDLERNCAPNYLPSFSELSIKPSIVIEKIDSVLRGDTTYEISDVCFLYNCKQDIRNFAAVSLKAETDILRYIIYSDKFYNELCSENTNWSVISIFAHEIGHHLFHHTDKRPINYRQSHLRELEADFFSGFILYKLGGSFANAQEGLNAMSHPESPEEEKYSYHPMKFKRIAAVKAGFEYAETKSNSIKYLIAKQDSLNNLIGIERDLNLAFQSYSNNNSDLALRSINNLMLKRFNNSSLLYSRGLIYTKKNKLTKAIADFSKAIEGDPFNALLYYNRAKAYGRMADKKVKNLVDKDLKIANVLLYQQGLSSIDQL